MTSLVHPDNEKERPGVSVEVYLVSTYEVWETGQRSGPTRAYTIFYDYGNALKFVNDRERENPRSRWNIDRMTVEDA